MLSIDLEIPGQMIYKLHTRKITQQAKHCSKGKGEGGEWHAEGSHEEFGFMFCWSPQSRWDMPDVQSESELLLELLLELHEPPEGWGRGNNFRTAGKQASDTAFLRGVSDPVLAASYCGRAWGFLWLFYKALKVNKGNSRKKNSHPLPARTNVTADHFAELFPSERTWWYDLFGKCSHLQCLKRSLV